MMIKVLITICIHVMGIKLKLGDNNKNVDQYPKGRYEDDKQ